MNFKKFIILPPLLLIFVWGMGQQKNAELVELQDGSMIRGEIVEYLVGKHIRIRTEEGKYHQFSDEEIKRVRSNKVKTDVSVKPLGYYDNTSLGLLVGQGIYNFQIIPSLQTVNGIQINRLSFGIGLGLEAIYSRAYAPIFADARFHLREGAFSPYVGLNAGYAVSLGNPPEDYWYYGNSVQYKGGMLGGFQLGVRNYSKRNLGFTASLGYRVQKLSSEYNKYFWDGGREIHIPVRERSVIHRVEVRFGILFN